jgi:hypothetical protein
MGKKSVVCRPESMTVELAQALYRTELHIVKKKKSRVRNMYGIFRAAMNTASTPEGCCLKASYLFRLDN